MITWLAFHGPAAIDKLSIARVTENMQPNENGHGYGCPLHGNKWCIMETLTGGLVVSAVAFHGCSKSPANLASPNVSPTSPSDSSLFNGSPNACNCSPNMINDRPNGVNVSCQLSFNGGDDSGKGWGSGGQGGGHGGHNSGWGSHYSGFDVLGMHALFLAYDEATRSGHKPEFYSLNSLHNTLALGGGILEDLSDETNAMHGDMPCRDQDDRIEVKPSIETKLDPAGSSQRQRYSSETMNNGPSSFSSSSSSSSAFHVRLPAHSSGPQGMMGWLGQLPRPAFAKQADSHEVTSKAEQLTQQESQVSSSEGVSTSELDSQMAEAATGAKQSDIDSLRRLQRETFTELMKLREKLEKLEQLAQARQKLEKLGAARTRLTGQIQAGTAFVLLEDGSSRQARDSLEQAGLQTGLDVKFTFETPFRENDVLITQCLSGQSTSVGDGRVLGGPLSVGKLQYVARVNDDVSLSFVPLGAQGKDVTEIINVLQDQGLTTFSSQGPALFNHCKGSALGATISGSRFGFTLAQYVSGWGNHGAAVGSLLADDPLCLSTLGQVLLQPTDGFILSLSGLNRYWPSPPLPSSTALHWSEMGPLVIPKILASKSQLSMVPGGSQYGHTNSIGSHWETPDLEYGVSGIDSNGTGLLSLAVASSLDVSENVSIGGWVEMEKGELWERSDLGNVQWSLSVAKTSRSGFNWGASIGRCRCENWTMPTYKHADISGYDGNGSHEPQLHVEAFLRLSCGKGFTLQPGLLYVMSQDSYTPAFVVRSSWTI